MGPGPRGASDAVLRVSTLVSTLVRWQGVSLAEIQRRERWKAEEQARPRALAHASPVRRTGCEQTVPGAQQWRALRRDGRGAARQEALAMIALAHGTIFEIDDVPGAAA